MSQFTDRDNESWWDDVKRETSAKDREAALHSVLPADCIIHLEEQLRPYECDGLSIFRQVQLAVVLPDNDEQVSNVLKVCRDLDVPVVARGAGTGLSGGAMPHASGVVLSVKTQSDP